MTRFPVLDVALEGFRLTRERPLSVLLWGVVLLLGQAAATAVLIGSGHGDALTMMRQPARTPDEMQARLAALAPAAPALAVAVLIGLAAFAVVYAALLRTVLQPGPRRAGGLRLGGDEARQLGLTLAFAVVSWLSLLAAVTCALILAAPLTLAAGGAQPLVTALVMALAAAAVIYVMTRLSLAPSRTAAEGRFVLFGAWPVTRGVFFPLLAAYLLATVLGFVVLSLASTIVAALWGVATGGGLDSAAAALQPDLRSFRAAASPASVAGLVVNGLLDAVLLAIVAAPGPAAYRVLAPRGITA